MKTIMERKLKPYERAFRMSDELNYELLSLFNEVIEDGGLLAFRDILEILIEATINVAEEAIGKSDDPKVVEWGESLLETANDLDKFLDKLVKKLKIYRR